MNTETQRIINVGNWTLVINQNEAPCVETPHEDVVSCVVTHNSFTPVVDTDQDIGAEDELGYRFTAKAIERKYDIEGEARLEQLSDNVSAFGLTFSIVIDSDEHFNLYVKAVCEKRDVKHLSIDDGNDAVPPCELMISVACSR